MNLQTAFYTNAGGRENNEDFGSYSIGENNSSGAWFVADGLGGHRDGEVASKIAVSTAIEMFQANPELNSSNIAAIFKTANKNITTDKINFFEKRTTMTGLFVKNDRALWAHVGDSRLYYFNGNRLVLQTKDHSVSQIAVDVGEITPDRIRFHPDRNKLIKVLGSGPDVVPEVTEHETILQPGDAFLLCTDGFWEYVYETEMEIDRSKSRSPTAWLEYMLKRHYRRAPDNCDNYTAMAVFVQ